MEQGYTKHVQIAFTFDNDGNIIDGSKEGQKDSRFVGVTFFTPEGERSDVAGKSPVIFTPYSKMTDEQKSTFDSLIENYISLKDKV